MESYFNTSELDEENETNLPNPLRAPRLHQNSLNENNSAPRDFGGSQPENNELEGASEDEDEENYQKSLAQFNKSLKKKMFFLFQVIILLMGTATCHFFQVSWTSLCVLNGLLGVQLAWRVYKNMKNLSVRKIYLLAKLMETCLVLTTSVSSKFTKISFTFTGHFIQKQIIEVACEVV